MEQLKKLEKTKKYHTVGTIKKTRKNKKIPLSEQLKKKLEKTKKYHTVRTIKKKLEKTKKYHTVGTIKKTRKNKKNTPLSEQLKKN